MPCHFFRASSLLGKNAHHIDDLIDTEIDLPSCPIEMTPDISVFFLDIQLLEIFANHADIGRDTVLRLPGGRCCRDWTRTSSRCRCLKGGAPGYVVRRERMASLSLLGYVVLQAC